MDEKLPAVQRIAVEYDDGSTDTVVVIQRGDFTIYGLTRKRLGSEQSHGAYSAAAIAALLFSTAVQTKWTEYSLRDKRLRDLVVCWFGDSALQSQQSNQGSHEQ